MKRVFIIFAIMIIISLFYDVYAFSYQTCVDEWKNGVAYCKGVIVTDQWSYDINNNKYVLLDENGHKIREVDNIEDNPDAKKGKIYFEAKVPDALKDTKINIDIVSDLYTYSIELNSENNYSYELEVNEAVYTINYHKVSNHDEIINPYPDSFKVNEKKVTSVTLDYSKYDNSSSNKKESKKNSNLVFILIGGFFLTVFIVILLMFLKARSI